MPPTHSEGKVKGKWERRVEGSGAKGKGAEGSGGKGRVGMSKFWAVYGEKIAA